MVLKQKPKDDASGDSPPANFATVTTHVSTCPTCDGDVVGGQGLLGCTDCDWAGLVS